MPERAISSGEERAEDEARFELGRTVATPGAIIACAEARIMPHSLLRRHQSCDWEDMCEEDKQANEHAVSHGGRVFSSYRLGADEKIWVITEADRSVTTVLTPPEY